ncbi:tripartite tricarboxylate transporter substrate binding protein [Pigmentiphaga soli]|uniref:Tripartite tricarboxylate transporter substrate binding protein n=1 Tax=Pigmentiphaga soli TaxID=1007095 RepID=A0ABP8GSV9_9BURK
MNAHLPSQTVPARRRARLFLCAALLLPAPGLLHAQLAPDRVIRLVIPFAVGSSTDAVSRIIAPELGKRLAATVIVDNRAGANGAIGAVTVAKAAPDGLTFLVGGASVNVINPALYRSLPYDPVADLMPVARIGMSPMMLLAHPSLPFKDVAGLIDYAHKHPGKLAYGTPNSVTMVGMENFKIRAGVDILSVPYKSSPQAVTDLVANQVQVLISEFATAMPLAKAGKARVIAVTSPAPSPMLPGVPTVAEVLEGFDVTGWLGLFAPRGTSPEIISRVSSVFVEVLSLPEIRERLRILGFDAAPLDSAAFGPYFTSQLNGWKKLVHDAGIQPE